MVSKKEEWKEKKNIKNVLKFKQFEEAFYGLRNIYTNLYVYKMYVYKIYNIKHTLMKLNNHQCYNILSKS